VNGVLTVKGGAGNDTIATGDGDDIITGGAGTDGITAGTGADTIDGGAGVDTYSVGATDSVVTTGSGATAAAAGIDTVTVTDLDIFALSNLTEALNATDAGAAVAVTLSDNTDDSTAAELLTAIDLAIDASAAQNDVFLIYVTDSGSGGDNSWTGAYLLGLNDGTASANDTLIQVLGTGVDASSTIAIVSNDVVFTI
jgi:Ca2+-binding RTX toxin-like protein